MLWRLDRDFLKFDILIVNINYIVLHNIFRRQLLKPNGFLFSVSQGFVGNILVLICVYDMVTVRASFVIKTQNVTENITKLLVKIKGSQLVS